MRGGQPAGSVSGHDAVDSDWEARRASMRPRAGVVLVLTLLSVLGGAAARAQEVSTPASAGASPIAGGDGVGPLHLVAQLTGADSINETDDHYGVSGTDLGHTFEHKGRLYMMFGDTFGPA